MDIKTKVQLAKYLQNKLHDHCSGYMFSDKDVLKYIDDFFVVAELVEERDRIQKQIDDLTE
ncbi:hypothetical protein [Oceanobacillus kimchii]|uniref:Phage protein n=1 Tax=Oceanobacillus kimchii TaxID=746691 RepID=A0ABQ5TH56_9BACI|nr:hypothetical protein [Oceanobacillus kimchii]GLO66198.1 hypothetical protein MACH08_19820 [Oceanobacillus kimchii]